MMMILQKLFEKLSAQPRIHVLGIYIARGIEQTSRTTEKRALFFDVISTFYGLTDRLMRVNHTSYKYSAIIKQMKKKKNVLYTS